MTGYASSTTELAYAAHNYAGQPWVDDQNGWTHHQDCIYYARCSQVTANNATSRVTHNHDWQTIIDQYPNCTLVGKQHNYCPTCGARQDLDDTPALGHDWYWHAETHNGISNGHLWVRCDRPGCDKYNPARDDSDRYRLVLDKDQHTQSVSQTATETTGKEDTHEKQGHNHRADHRKA